MKTPRSPLRSRILIFLLLLVGLTVFGSGLTVFRIAEVNRTLSLINQNAIPLGRSVSQLASDSEVFKREYERLIRVSDANEFEKRIRNSWMVSVLRDELTKLREQIERAPAWPSTMVEAKWKEWVVETQTGFEQSLSSKDLSEWLRRVQWGVAEYDHTLRSTLSGAQGRISDLRTGLEILLGVVVGLSLLLIWLGERALRPLAALTALARSITLRGLKREDKEQLPRLFLSRNSGDEVGQLAREFHHMASALLEREKEIEVQKDKLADQNGLLREIAALNESILLSIESILIVVDSGDPTGSRASSRRITRANPAACAWLKAPLERVIGKSVSQWPELEAVLEGFSERSVRIEPRTVGGRVFGGAVTPLLDRRRDGGAVEGAILVLHDLTEEKALEERLRQAESLAAIGRMSAQIAHEIRNPLHSLGLEAEMALDDVNRGNESKSHLQSCLKSILENVERLEQVTQNYLSLSKSGTVTVGRKSVVSVVEVLENVFATYSPLCEAKRVQVDWSTARGADGVDLYYVLANPSLLEQAFGNLIKNAIQELGSLADGVQRKIYCEVGPVSSEAGSGDSRFVLRVTDSGRGVSEGLKTELFKPFVTTKSDGSGLGLSLVKQVVDEMGATIEVKSGNGAGGCFGALFEITFERAGLFQNQDQRVELEAP